MTNYHYQPDQKKQHRQPQVPEIATHSNRGEVWSRSSEPREAQFPGQLVGGQLQAHHAQDLGGSVVCLGLLGSWGSIPLGFCGPKTAQKRQGPL